MATLIFSIGYELKQEIFIFSNKSFAWTISSNAIIYLSSWMLFIDLTHSNSAKSWSFSKFQTKIFLLTYPDTTKFQLYK